MDSDEEVTWIITKNTVKDRMIESSLIHRFSNSKKFQKRTLLLNNLLQKYHNLTRYQDYVKLKKVSSQKIHTDRETEDDNSYGEEYYSISHKKNLSSLNDSAFPDENINISHKSTCNNNVKKSKDKISKKKDTSPTASKPNKISSTELDLHKKDRKRLKILQIDHESDDIVPVKKKRSKHLSKSFEKIDKTEFVHSKKNSSNSLNTNDSNVLSNTGINHTKAVLDNKCNNSLIDDTKDKQIDNFTHKSDIVEDKINEPNTCMNHLQLSNKSLTNEEIHLHLPDDEKNKVVDHSKMSEVVNQDIEENVFVPRQEKVTCNSSIIHDNINLSDVTNKKHKNDVSSLNSVVISSPRSPPKIKSTEIVDKKYKIINKERSYDKLSTEFYNGATILISSTPISFPRYKEVEEYEENEEHEDNLNSSMLSTSNRRLQQLRNLNLTLESSASSSEDEMPQPKNNLNETTMLNNSSCITSKQNTSRIKLKLNRSYDTDNEKDKTSFDTQNINNSTSHNNNIDQHKNYNKDLTTHKKISSKNVESKIQMLSERPCNLENFIKEENIVEDTTVSAFELQDLSKDEDIFLIDLPITVQLADLQGQKITLKKKNIKLGKNKYEILYKDTLAQSCVFSTCKDNKSYKIVNIKPTGSVIVKRKLFPLPVPTYSKQDTKSYNNVHKNK
ncbi:hypothetical protein KPH14_006694 [Odynerus spinipes]|uniref:Uncharacterized protein n=1 Tax=Odynerus spinipes TaxID=1348599 RepID=A0AAD9VRG2_9HYME|nr:hypothetical protein KPH14_006694 [Odynerus spinipes]